MPTSEAPLPGEGGGPIEYDLTYPEGRSVTKINHPEWCANYRPDDDHGTHSAGLGTIAARNGTAVLSLWQTVGNAGGYVQMTTDHGVMSEPCVSLFLSPRQAAALGRRLLDGATLLNEG